MSRFEPPDPMLAPRYTGVRTFARLPHVEVPHRDVDAAVIGVPFDTATSFRSGARFGPEAIRAGSTLLRPYHPVLDVDVFGTLSVVDGGDLAVTPGNALRTTEQIDAGLRPVLGPGSCRSCWGAITRSCSVSCAPSTACTDRWRWCCSTPTPTPGITTTASATSTERLSAARWRRGWSIPRARCWPACAVRLCAGRPPRAARARVRGDPGTELVKLSPEEYGARVRRRLGSGPVYLSFDIDVLDPASAPGTGTPEVAGLHPREALAFLRALAGISFTGFDVVEVAPAYDSPGQITALNAAAVAFDLLALLAVTRR